MGILGGQQCLQVLSPLQSPVSGEQQLRATTFSPSVTQNGVDPGSCSCVTLVGNEACWRPLEGLILSPMTTGTRPWWQDAGPL